MKPLTLYTHIPKTHGASHYYRLSVPLKTAHELGLPIHAIVDQDDPQVSPADRARAFCESDMVFYYQPIGAGAINGVQGIQSFIPSKRDGEWKWPPSVVIETDDNLFNVSPLNGAYRGLGTRDMNGEEIPDGNHIGVVRGGEQKVLWADGENGFSLAKNRQTIATYRTMLSLADAVQCSTPEVRACIEKEVAPRRIAVFPNLVRFQDYEQLALPQDDTVRILWQGGSAHYEDWHPLRAQIANITRKYPQVHWIIWGVMYHWVMQDIPADRYTYHDWCGYEEYKLRLVMQNHDISLAPLGQNVFNRCRSAIKWYEASVLHKPAATLAQNSGAYKHEMQDGETGLLFDDPEQFETQLGRLIEDVTLRKTLASNAKDWINEHRNANKEVPKMVRFWEQIREERSREQPHVTDQEWEKIEAEALAEEASV